MSETSQAIPTFAQLLDVAIRDGASDLHLVADCPPMVRVDSALRPLEYPVFTAETVTGFISDFLGATLYEKMVTSRKELDFSLSYSGLRFRCNTYFERGSLAASLRLLPKEIPDLDSLGLPSMAGKLLDHNQGLIVVAGPTGHGKSTTLAAMTNRVLQQRRWHVITIEDPIEYVFEHHKGIVSQREIGSDTPSFGSALRTALREDPDMVLVGEMRDQETVEAALQLAQTGHLVISTLHTNSASQTASRIIDIFPPHQQEQARVQLSESLIGIVSQRLLPKLNGGRALAAELLIANAAVRSIIREDKTHQLPNLIQTSGAEGMISLDKSLAELVTRGEVAIDDALAWSLDPKALKMMIY
jgi:twitching motility protein PilT